MSLQRASNGCMGYPSLLSVIAIGSMVLNFSCTSSCGYAAELYMWRAVKLLEPWQRVYVHELFFWKRLYKLQDMSTRMIFAYQFCYHPHSDKRSQVLNWTRETWGFASYQQNKWSNWLHWPKYCLYHHSPPLTCI
jgi:hypothetical protein